VFLVTVMTAWGWGGILGPRRGDAELGLEEDGKK
jgi:hypothetical protein